MDGGLVALDRDGQVVRRDDPVVGVRLEGRDGDDRGGVGVRGEDRPPAALA
ncbi:hypothetical protein ACFQL4_15420 [Halosimplex aquaticum]